MRVSPELPNTKMMGVSGVVLPQLNISLGTPASAGAVTAPVHPVPEGTNVSVGAGTGVQDFSSLKIKAQRVMITAIAHATEEPLRVRDAILKVVGTGAGVVEVREEKLSGHFKTHLVKLSATLNGRAAMTFLEALLERLSPLSLRRLAGMMQAAFDEDETTLFLRFDKQDAVRDGVLSLCESEAVGGSVSVGIKFTRYPPAKPSDVRDALREKVMLKAARGMVD